MKCKKCNADVVVHLYDAILWGTCDNEACDWESEEITLPPGGAYGACIEAIKAHEEHNIETTWAIDKDWDTIKELAGNEEKTVYLRCPAKAILWLKDKVAELQEHNNGQDDRFNLLKHDCMIQTSRYALMVKKVGELYTNLDATDAIAEGHTKKIAKLDDSLGITDGLAATLDTRLSNRIAKIEAANPSNDGLWIALNKLQGGFEIERGTRIAAFSEMGDRVRGLEENYKMKREKLAELERSLDVEIKRTNKDLDGKIESLDKNRFRLIDGLSARIDKLEAVTPSEDSQVIEDIAQNRKLLDKFSDDVDCLVCEVAGLDGLRRKIGILENNVRLLLEDVGS